MASPNYMTSDDLIEKVKLQGMIPEASGKTFSEENILSLAKDEIDIGLVPDILTYFESYFLYLEDIPLVSNQASYDIPYRAIGLRLQDVVFKDSSNNMYEMARVQPDERIFFQFSQGNFNNTYRFYVENNSIVLIPGVGTANGSLEMNYYMSPNKLVKNERAAIANTLTFNTTIECNSVTSGDSFVVNGVQYTAGTDFSVTGTDNDVANSIAAALSGSISASVSSNIVSLTSVNSAVTSLTSTTSLQTDDNVTLLCDALPTNIAEGSLIDFLQSKPGFKTYDYDYELPTGSIDYVAKTITIPTEDLPRQFSKNDYVATAGECIIPQVPVELFPVLIQRVVCRCLEAMGDTQGLENAKAKLNDMILKMGNLIDNRVESAPQKIFNKGSPLRISKFRQRNFFRY